ncbi:hypothetical protein K9L67_04895 [Candidatus Woesearchaeota archaeon]|nr:hypothetical protein [Candidatus Woesearchaeota archaeon]MCF7901536.1 hypothetical protein [Candidatus Woesearchaeota archaeon]MCF8013880.1 hypothetical protein [Candidatus Woesearchaeota archaeon]
MVQQTKKTNIKKQKDSKAKPDQTMAIVGLLLNILVVPGLGSLINNKIKEGVWQLVLFFGGLIIGFLLTITIIGAIIGVPLMVIAPLAGWIWSIVTGVQLVQESNK